MSNYLTDGYHRESAAYAPTSERMAFIRRTYALLAVAILGLVGLEAILLYTDFGVEFMKTVAGSTPLLIGTLVLFIASGFIAQYLARSDFPPAVQLMGLAIYVAFEALILLFPLYVCTRVPHLQNVPMQAAIMTLVVFGGLSAVVFISKRDFSFLGKILFILSLVALGIIVCSFFTPINLGVWFSAAMIGLACGYILYDTSNVLHHYPTNAHVAAALELFASVALLFFYILRLMMQLASSNE